MLGVQLVIIYIYKRRTGFRPETDEIDAQLLRGGKYQSVAMCAVSGEWQFSGSEL